MFECILSKKLYTPLILTKEQERIYYEEYESTLESSTRLDVVMSDMFGEEYSEFLYYKNLLHFKLMLNFKKHYGDEYSSKIFSVYDNNKDFSMDEIYEGDENYLIVLKYNRYNRERNKKILFKDRHSDYYQYKPLSVETFQKYNSVLIGRHTWYSYKVAIDGKVEKVIDRSLNYDTLYPICWSSAIKIAKRKGIKEKYPELIVPIGYPNELLEKAYWLIRDGVKEVKIDTYLQDK